MGAKTMVDQRSGYWIIQWSTHWDPSIKDLVRAEPSLVIGNFIAITSCDSGPYMLSDEEIADGWRTDDRATLSARISNPQQLPAPGFDEWYVFDHPPVSIPSLNHVKRLDFSVFGDDEYAKSFWRQVDSTQPLNALGCGTPNMFLLTRNERIFSALRELSFAS